ncbi:MAG: YbjQ family protein [Gammaproteobacteria bacterium]
MLDIIILISLLGLGYYFGQRAEKKHYKSIIERENQLINLPLITLKTPPPIKQYEVNAALVTGSVVISIDFFKKFIASLKMLFGGRLTTYESLLDRARREALLRLREQAKIRKAFVVLNTRIETASISKSSGRREGSVGSIEVVAYGTAISMTNRRRNIAS